MNKQAHDSKKEDVRTSQTSEKDKNEHKKKKGEDDEEEEVEEKEEKELDSEEMAKKIKADKKKKKEEEKARKEEEQKEKKQEERLNTLLKRLNGAEEKLKVTQDKIVANSSKRAAKATEFLEEASILEKEVEDQKQEEHVLDKSVKKAVENSLINIQNARLRSEKEAENLKDMLKERNKTITDLQIKLKETESVSNLREQKIKELEKALKSKSKELERIQKISDGRARAEEIDIQDRRNHQVNKIAAASGKQKNQHTINLNTGKVISDEFDDFWKTNEDAAVVKHQPYGNDKNTNLTLDEITKGKDLWISQMDNTAAKKITDKRGISIDRSFIENQGVSVITKINEVPDMKRGSQAGLGQGKKSQDKGEVKLPAITNTSIPMIRQHSQSKYKSPSPGNTKILRA